MVRYEARNADKTGGYKNLNTEIEHESSGSTSGQEAESGFASRLKALQGGKSLAQFALECGLGESLMRKYLAGSVPGIDKATQIAARQGVRLDWLATGEGPVRPGDVERPLPPLHLAEEKAPLYRACIAAPDAATILLRVFREAGYEPSGAWGALLVSLLVSGDITEAGARQVVEQLAREAGSKAG